MNEVMFRVGFEGKYNVSFLTGTEIKLSLWVGQRQLIRSMIYSLFCAVQKRLDAVFIAG